VTRDDLDELLDEIDSMDDSPTRLSLLHRAIDGADQLQEVELGYQLRQVLIGTALEIGKGDQLAVAFSWCLAQYDQNPQRFESDETQILWRFRWVIDELTDYYQVSKQQLESLVEDMTRRYEAAGVSLRAVHMLKLNVALKLWDKKTAADCLKSFRKSRRDLFSDDPDSELGFEVLYDIECGRYKLAASKGEKFLSGPLGEEFNTTKIRSMMAVPLVLLGDIEKAVFCHRTAVKYAKSNPRHVGRVACHINFLTITDNTSEAVKLFTTSLDTALVWIDPWGKMIFLAAGLFLFEHLAKVGDKPVKMRLPESFEHRNAKGSYVPSELAKQLRADTEALVDEFNARNGNTFASELLNDIAKYHKHITPAHLSKTK
jgi:cellulose synthase operon protein C